MENNSNYIDILCYLGGNLGIVLLEKKNIDLEDFFIESCEHLYDEPRVVQCILNWIFVFEKTLSAHIIEQKIFQKNEKNLGRSKNIKFLVEFCAKYSHDKSKWKSLQHLLSNIPKIDLPFYFRPNVKHYLKSEPYFKNFCPEITARLISSI